MQSPVIDSSKSLFNQDKSDGIDIIFQNIYYSLKIKDLKTKNRIPFKKSYFQKQILKGISGIFKYGRLNAIMGVSGAGKTTLLNILACRLKPTKNGKLYANNIVYSESNFGYFANYVMQNDFLLQTLTVRETLQFGAQLKLGHLSPQQKNQQVLKIANRMKLQKCLDTLIGGILLKGISGGQKKRTSIAFELLSDPQVIFLDQPTSGLDSLTSYIICSQLKKLAHERKKTVIMTIHQPNSETFALFDDLMILLQGKIIYQSSAQQVSDYFERKFNLVCPQFMNPSDFFISKIHHGNEKNQQLYPLYFQTYDQYQKIRIQRRIIQKETSKINFRKSDISYIRIVRALLYRQVINHLRHPRIVGLKLAQSIFVALFVGGMFFGDGKKDYTKLPQWLSITGFFLFISLISIVTTMSPISLVVPTQRGVLFKQLDSKLYNSTQIFLTKNIIQLPTHFIITLIYASIYYFMIGLSNTAGQFLTHWLILGLLSFCGVSLGLLIGSIALDIKDGPLVLTLTLLPMLCFSGYFKNRKDLPGWIRWIEYLSPNNYALNGLVQNQVAYRDSLAYILNFQIGKWEAIGILFAVGIFYGLVALFCIWFFRKIRK